MMDWDRIFAYLSIVGLAGTAIADIRWNWLGRVLDWWGDHMIVGATKTRDKKAVMENLITDQTDQRIRDVLDYCHLSKSELHFTPYHEENRHGWSCWSANQIASGATPLDAMVAFWKKYLSGPPGV